MSDLLSPTEYRLLLFLLASGVIAQAACLLKTTEKTPSLGMLLCSIWSLVCGFVLMNCDPDAIGKPLFLLSFVPFVSGLSGILSWLSHHLPERLK